MDEERRSDRGRHFADFLHWAVGGYRRRRLLGQGQQCRGDCYQRGCQLRRRTAALLHDEPADGADQPHGGRRAGALCGGDRRARSDLPVASQRGEHPRRGRRGLRGARGDGRGFQHLRRGDHEHRRLGYERGGDGPDQRACDGGLGACRPQRGGWPGGELLGDGRGHGSVHLPVAA